MAVKYIARVGITYKAKDGNRRVEIGEVVPTFVIKRSPWLVEQSLVEEAGEEVPDVEAENSER